MEEHYHEINALIEEQERALKNLDSQIDRTYGQERLDLYQKKIELLNKQADAYRKKINEAKDGLDRNLTTLSELGLTPQYDEESGLLTNYTDLVL
jgi:phage-related tail protein